MAKTLRGAVIGTGAIGLDHLQSLQQCRRAVPVAFAEPNVNVAGLAPVEEIAPPPALFTVHEENA